MLLNAVKTGSQTAAKVAPKADTFCKPTDGVLTEGTKLKGATLRKIIERITEDDYELGTTFVLTFRLFASAEELFALFKERWNGPPEKNLKEK